MRVGFVRSVCPRCVCAASFSFLPVLPVFPPCTPGLCLCSVTFPLHSSFSVHVSHVMRSPSFCLSVCLTPLLPVRIVGKPFRRSLPLSVSLSLPLNPIPVVNPLTSSQPMWSFSCQWQSAVSSHLEYVFFFSLGLFMMFKWPLVVRCSYCSLFFWFFTTDARHTLFSWVNA